MSLLTTIGGRPLFTSPNEALSWALSNGLSGYHTHTFNNTIGYMGGITHDAAINTNYLDLVEEETSSEGDEFVEILNTPTEENLILVEPEVQELEISDFENNVEIYGGDIIETATAPKAVKKENLQQVVITPALPGTY
tara:strand:- start:191 stop:604 length:414 start_codon:yes stop_codon:yes gene_type:complete